MSRLPDNQSINLLLSRPDNNSILYYGIEPKVSLSIERELILYNQYSTPNNDNKFITSKNTLNIIENIKKLDFHLYNTNFKSNGSFPIDDLLYDRTLNSGRNLIIISNLNPSLVDFQIPSDNFYIFLNPNYTVENINHLELLLMEHGDWALGSDIVSMSKTIARETFISDFNQLAVIILISAINLITLTFVNIKNFGRYIAIYMINGCKKITTVLIYFVYLFGILVTSTGVFYLIYLFIKFKMKSAIAVSDIMLSIFTFNLKVQFLTFGSILVFIIVGSLVPYYFMSKKSKINFLKSN